MNVVVTGAGSMVGRCIMSSLEEDPGIGSILALDIRPYQGPSSPKIRARIADIRDRDALMSAFSSADAVIHLAFVVLPDDPDAPAVRETNIEGARRVLQAAAASGVRKVIYTSSVAAYGAVPGNPLVLTEEAPCRGSENERDFYYAYTKAAVEGIMEEFSRAHPEIVVTRFRSHILVGPRVLEGSAQLRLLAGLGRPSRSFWGFRPVGPNGRLVQYTHEDDLAQAVRHALHHDMPGAYNIAGEPLDLESYLRSKGKSFRRVPWAAADTLALLASPFSPRARLARHWLVSARYRNILDCSKLRRSGFDRPLRSTYECLEEAAAFERRRRADGAAGRRPEPFLGWSDPGWAVITGASSGIGAEFARRLAAEGFSLLLTARREGRLRELAESLGREHGTATQVLAADLGRIEDVRRLAERIGATDGIDVLVNNAGFSTVGPFSEADPEGQMELINVQAAAPVILTRAAVPAMVRRKRGLVVFTSSTSAFLPAPGSGVYIPAKAFLVSLARTLAPELGPAGVRVQALCPGYTRTEFHAHAAFGGLKDFLPGWVWGTSRDVVETSLRQARKRRVVVIPGLLNRLTVRLVPKSLLLRSYMKTRWKSVAAAGGPRRDRA